MINYFTFNGKSCRDFGVYTDGANAHLTSSRLYDEVEVSGRNGKLLISRDMFSNIELSYPCFITSNFASNFADMTAYLNSVKGYARLTDTYNSTIYRMARYTGGTMADIGPFVKDGKFDIIFDCKPQKFLLSGETSVTPSSGDTLTNPTYYGALPLIRAYGDGTLQIANSEGSYQITISGSPYTYIDIDCEIMDAYSSGNNCNEYITLTNGFPVLAGGSNTITFSTISSVEVTPRWWTV